MQPDVLSETAVVRDWQQQYCMEYDSAEGRAFCLFVSILTFPDRGLLLLLL